MSIERNLAGPRRDALVIVGMIALVTIIACSAKPQHARSIPTAQENNAVVEKFELSDEEWRERLTPEEYRVLREKGTEYSGTGDLLACKDDGTYICAGCGHDLFGSDAKYNSKTGWPSFWKPHGENAVAEHADNSLLEKRVEVVCARCDGHLGHVFPGGPQPTGLRYCINSVSLNFRKSE